LNGLVQKKSKNLLTTLSDGNKIEISNKRLSDVYAATCILISEGAFEVAILDFTETYVINVPINTTGLRTDFPRGETHQADDFLEVRIGELAETAQVPFHLLSRGWRLSFFQ
jgi:hypothetical protein